MTDGGHLPCPSEAITCPDWTDAPAPILVAAGGWCAPTSVTFDPHDWPPEAAEAIRLASAAVHARAMNLNPVAFPTVSVNRGGINYDALMDTPARQAARAAIRVTTERIVANFARARTDAIDTACVTALTHGWDVHVYEPPKPYDVHHATATDLLRLRCIGIEFTPAAHPIPTIHHHDTGHDDWYDDEDD